MLKCSLIIACVLLLSMTCHATSLSLLTEEYPPYNFSTDQGRSVSGLSTDLIIEMMRRIGFDVHIAVVPWQRALAMTATNANTCVYSTIRSPERERHYKWIGPLTTDQLALFALAANPILLHSIDDARSYRIGTYVGSVANAYLVLNQVVPDIAPDDKLNPKKLAAGRIDLWVASTRTGPYTARQAGVQITPRLTINTGGDNQMYLACNLDMPDSRVAALNAALVKMKIDGAYLRILNKYR